MVSARYLLMAVFAFLALMPAAQAVVAAVSLDECFQAAAKRSEVIADQSELILQAEEHYKQATGSILPSVNFVASYSQQQLPQTGIGNAISPGAQPLVKFTASQPLFRGFREFAGLRATAALTDVQKEAWAQAMSQLYNDVAQNYFLILSLEHDYKNVQTEISLYQDRVKDLRGRVKIGRSRDTEILTTVSTQAALKAQVEALGGQIKGAREAFHFLTGLSQDTVVVDPTDTEQKIATLEAYLSKLDSRPDMRVAVQRRRAAEENVSIAKGAHLPNVDLTGNYYLKRSGVNENVNWDVQIALVLPIYAGGVLASHVREAASQERETNLSVSRFRRLAEQEIRTSFESLRADQNQIKALVEAEAVARRNYVANERDYRFGLVTNLDVIQALTIFQESKRALDRSRYAERLDLTRLRIASAELPAS